MEISKHTNKIKSEIYSMYDSDEHSSIIFEFNDSIYLSMKSDKTYFINPNENLYKNILFEIILDKSIRKINNSSFFVKNHTPDSLTKKVGADIVPVFKPTGVILEIDEKNIIFENLTIFSSFFINKSLSKQEAYSLLLSESFQKIFNIIVKNPSKHVSLINK